MILKFLKIRKYVLSLLYPTTQALFIEINGKILIYMQSWNHCNLKFLDFIILVNCSFIT